MRTLGPRAHRRVRRTLGRTALLLGVGLLIAIPGGLPLGSAPAAAPSTAIPPPTFTLASADPTAVLSREFWGADTRAFYPANSSLTAVYRNSPLESVRWPGGAVAEQYDLIGNRIYHDDGSSYVPPTGISQFASWCVALNCSAIVQLPAEIDSPAIAAREVQYIESGIGFHPSYYEIGNEPTQWNHFGYSWANWTVGQATNTSPAEYARLVQNYTSAIHAVAPDARIVGLPGVGTGAYNEPLWIRSSVRMNGPNLSGVAIHVYPAGPGPPSGPNLTQFYGSLRGGGSLAARIPLARAAVRAGCPGCGPIPVFVTELGSGNGAGSYNQFMSSYYDVPFIAAEIVQGIDLNVSILDLFALAGTYPGSLLTGSSSLSPVGVLYGTLFRQLGRGVLNGTPTVPSPGVFLSITRNGSAGPTQLLVVNTNVTTAEPIELAGSGFPTGRGTVWTWDGSTPAPVAVPYNGSVPLRYTVPPLGLLLVSANPQVGRILDLPPLPIGILRTLPVPLLGAADVPLLPFAGLFFHPPRSSPAAYRLATPSNRTRTTVPPTEEPTRNRPNA